jgi:hypothetical protein
VFPAGAKQTKGPRSRGREGPDIPKAHAMRIQRLRSEKSGTGKSQRPLRVCHLERDPMICSFFAGPLGQNLQGLARSLGFCAASTVPELSIPRRAEKGQRKHCLHVRYRTITHPSCGPGHSHDLRLPPYTFHERAAEELATNLSSYYRHLCHTLPSCSF